MINYIKTYIAILWMFLLGRRGDFAVLTEKTAICKADDLSAEICDELIARIITLTDIPHHPRIWRDNTASDTRILGFEHDIGDDLCRHLNIDQQIAAIRAYTGRRVKSWFLMANRLVPKEGNTGSGGGWHRDSPFSHQIKCIWYLNDVHGDNGPFCYLPQTHQHIIENRKYYPIGQSRFNVIHHTPHEVHAKAGTLIICDTKAIHRGKPIMRDKRFAITLYTHFHKKGAADLFRKHNLDPALAKQKPLAPRP